MINMRKNKVVLTICGMELSLLSDDSVEYVKATGRMVDDKMKKMIEGNNRLSVAMAAIVAALDYCDELQKTNGSIDNLRAEIKQYLEESAAYRKDAEDARREVERLKRELQTMRMRAGEKDPYKAASQAAKLPTPPAINNVPKSAEAAVKAPEAGAAKEQHPADYKTLDSFKNGEKREQQPNQGTNAVRKPRLYGKDAYAESADVTQEIMKFFGENND